MNRVILEYYGIVSVPEWLKLQSINSNAKLFWVKLSQITHEVLHFSGCRMSCHCVKCLDSTGVKQWPLITPNHHSSLYHIYIQQIYTRKHKDLYIFVSISQNRDGAYSWNPSSWKTGTHVCCIVNIMAGNDLAMQGARALTAMVLIQLSWGILISASDGLKFNGKNFSANLSWV